jgi:hypothetical protein
MQDAPWPMRGEGRLATSARLPQHVHALKRANNVRCGRAALKRTIAAGRVDVSEVLLAPPSFVATMTLGELLMSQKGWGHVRSAKFLRSAGLTEIKTLGNLTQRQRQSLAVLLTGSLIADRRPSGGFLEAVGRQRVERTFQPRPSIS